MADLLETIKVLAGRVALGRRFNGHWLLLPGSEFVWFLSNCYHRVHLNTYGDPRTGDETEPSAAE